MITRRRLVVVATRGWVVLLVGLLTAPMWTSPGYGLARDMVFTPRYPFGPETFGTGAGLPRAVPVDAVLALFTSVLDGAVVFRVAVAGVLLLAGWGAQRFLPFLPPGAQCAAAAVAVWNPFVVERVALGQWALVATYAALLWLVPAWRATLRGDRIAAAATLPFLALGSLTPSGGLMVALAAVATSVVPSGSVSPTPRARLWVAARGGPAQLPWVLPSLLGEHDARSDPDGAAAFAARSERPGGIWLTLLGGGGTWSRFVVPASLTSPLGHLVTLLAVVVVLAGLPRVWRRAPAVVILGLGCLPVAGLAHLPGGEAMLAWTAAQLPGGGLLRDGQKWLLPWLVLVTGAAGEAARRFLRWVRRHEASLVGVAAACVAVLPLAALPDAPRETWPALRPVTYPADLTAAVDILDGAARAGDSSVAVTLPFEAYRRYRWGNDLSAAEPVSRWSRLEVVASDRLATTKGTLAGEDPRTDAVAQALAQADPAAALSRLGVGWVLEYRGQPDARPVRLTGARLVLDGAEVRVWRLTTESPGAAADLVGSATVPGWAVVVFALWAGAAVGGAVLASWWRLRGGRHPRRVQRAGSSPESA